MAHWPETDGRRRAARRALGLVIASLGAAVFAPGAVDASEAARASDAEHALAFSRRSELVATRTLAELEAVVESATVRVFEPYEQGEAAFRALPFDRVLDAVYSASWRSEEEVLFTCRDGYQPTVPVARITSHRPWLAFDRVDAPGFTIRKRESGEVKRIELDPFYLVWENLDDPKIRQESDYGWPYQLVAVDLIRTADRYPKLVPPDESSPEVLAGFAAFRIHCSKCHALNGEGGSIGPELNAAASPLEYRDREYLRTWIENPSRIRANARMPALNPALPDRARTVDDILAYLEAMRGPRKQARPDDD